MKVGAANAIASALNVAASPVTAAVAAGGTSATATLDLVSKTDGSSQNGAITVTNVNGLTASTAGMTGGSDQVSTTTYDAGTISLTIGGSLVSASYGQNDTPQTLAQALVAAINAASLPITAAPGQGSGTLLLTASQAGAAGNGIAIAASAASNDPADFPAGSFSAASPGTLSGGVNPSLGSVLYSYSLQHAPDEQVTQAIDSINGTWNYAYDDFNRLITAQQVDANSNVLSGLSWDYDRYGNRWNQNITAGTGTTAHISFNAANNQAAATLGYDLSGNVVNDGNHQYVFDAEDRILQVDGGIAYVYDAEGRRVGKTNGTVYVVGLAGKVLDELDNGQWARSEVYAGARHFATVNPAGVVFTHPDWLGTERARTNIAGALCEAVSSQPFGDNSVSLNLQGVAGCPVSPDFFTGKQRDGESNLDDFGARYFSSQWGHWMSPDWSSSPEPVPYANLANPQSFNLYAYVNNDPVDGEDVDGHAMYLSPWGSESGDYPTQGPMAMENEQTTPASLPQYNPDCNCFQKTVANNRVRTLR